MDNLLRMMGIEPKVDWKMLLLHEGSDNTIDIEQVCKELGIPVKYENIESDSYRLEAMYVYTTDLFMVDLIKLLVNKNLMSL
jgi:hypothetical protein